MTGINIRSFRHLAVTIAMWASFAGPLAAQGSTGSGVTVIGQRQTRQGVPMISPTERLQNRIQNRVVSRLTTRIDSRTSPTKNVTDAYIAASRQATATLLQ